MSDSTKNKKPVEEQVQRVLDAGERAKHEDQADKATSAAGDKIHDAANKAEGQVNQTANRLQAKTDDANRDTSRAIEEVRNRTNAATQGAREVASDLRSTDGSDIAAAAEKQGDAAMTTTGNQMSNLANQLRQQKLDGTAGDLARQAADALEQSGTYLQRTSPAQAQQDITHTIQDRPVQAVLIGVGIGFVLGRILGGGKRRGY